MEEPSGSVPKEEPSGGVSLEDRIILMDACLFEYLQSKPGNWKRRTVDVSVEDTTIFMKENRERLALAVAVQKEYQGYGCIISFAWAAKVLFVRHRSALKIQTAYRAFKGRMDTS